MKMARRITALVLAVLMLAGSGMTHAHAVQLRNSQFKTSYVNPLYENILTEENLTSPSHQSSHTAASSEEDTYYTPHAAAEQIRQQLVGRQETITVNVYLEQFEGTQTAFDELCLDLASDAMQHTGVPTEGDYLLWQFGGYNAGANYAQSSEGLHLLRITFTFTYYTDAAQEAELDAAVAELLAELDVNEEDSYTKLKAIYDYICANVEYDNDNANNQNYKLQYTAYAALIDGTAVCQGYSLLLYRLALELGVDCRLISGDGGGPHAWNIAEIDGYYYNMDPTWDAGKDSYSYFLRSPENFSGHTRDAEYDTAAFHSAYPMAQSDFSSCAHVFESKVTVPPQCTEDGVMTYTCSVCGYSYEDAIPATGHSYDDGIITAPTCTEQGYTTYTCLVCGDSCMEGFVDALGHDYGEWYPLQEPTCTAEGIRQHDCQTCGASETEIIPALGHTYTAIVTEPTCTEQGFTTYTCVCGETYTDNYTDALGHTYGDWYPIQEPTCTEEGIQQHDCLECGASETEVIAALGHEYQDYQCIRCDVLVPMPFEDVRQGDYYHIPVLWALDNGITTGTSETTFAPEKTATRAEVITFIWRAEGKPEPTSTHNPFTDVKEGRFYYKAVLWAVEQGITTGTSETTFSPHEDCSRSEVVTFLWRTVGKPAPTNSNNPFLDVKADRFYSDAVLWAVEHGVTNGMDPEYFGVHESCNRAHVVTFLYRTDIN